MVEPAGMLVAKAVAGPIIQTAHRKTQAAIAKAEDARRTDLERTLANIAAADAAIQGLGGEWEDLLALAKRCPLRDTDAVQQLVNRLEGYLTTNWLRDELRLALDGLNEEREVIEGRSRTIRQFPWKRKNRQRALERYIDISTELSEFLESLGSLQYMNPSGVGWKHLKDIQEVLCNRMLDLEQAKLQVEQLVQKARDDPRIQDWRKLRSEIKVTHSKLVRAFR
jgi:hypothetical protein